MIFLLVEQRLTHLLNLMMGMKKSLLKEVPKILMLLVKMPSEDLLPGALSNHLLGLPKKPNHLKLVLMKFR